VLVVTHLSQELKFQLTQDLSVTQKTLFHCQVCMSLFSRKHHMIALLLTSTFALFCYLAVSSSDHVDVVAYQFECKAPVHQCKAALQRGR